MKSSKIIYPFFALLILVACQPKPEPINYGKDDCRYCKMSIVEKKYGAELVNDKGKVLKFDAAECMVNFMDENPAEYSFVLATPYDKPETLEDVQSMTWLISEELPSPMGADLSAFSNKEACQNKQKEVGGDIYSWEEIKTKVSKKHRHR